MKNKIERYLNSLEAIENIRILYACESGSRMWNIDFEDSDYDVRFIYHRPIYRYISLEKSSDVIDINNCCCDIIHKAKSENIDIVGWDLRKYLSLFYKSNSVCFEWLHSPIVYRKNISFYNDILTLTEQFFDFKSIFCSYLGLAISNTNKYLQDELVYIKKYLYSVRPILVCKFLLHQPHFDNMILDFKILKSMLNYEVREIVDKILFDRSSEKNRSLRLRKLDDYINHNIFDLSNKRAELKNIESKNINLLDNIIHKYIGCE